MHKVAIFLVIAAATGCSGGTTKVSTKSAPLEPGEVFWAKNQLAVQTELPGEARFQNFEIMALSNGDRVYCGQMNAISRSGISEGFVPFYMRRSAGTVKAVNTGVDNAEFSAKKCAEARNGALRINKV